MYGIIIDGVRYMVQERFGEEVLAQVLAQSQLSLCPFTSHERYSEHMLPNLLASAVDVTGLSADEIGVLAGRYFIHFMCKYGYGELMRVLGRRFADFLKGLDNLHEYFRFSYPKIRPPSFYCEKETATCLTLHYRSRRQGYISYVMGQLMEIAKIFFNQDITIKVSSSSSSKCSTRIFPPNLFYQTFILNLIFLQIGEIFSENS